MKKSRIRVLIMMLSVCFGTFFFGGETTAKTFEDFEYDTTNHGENIKITKYVGTAEEVVIPEEIDGKKVLTIGGAAFMSRNNITSVTIPDTVTGISGMAFSGCSGLEVVVLPNSVTTLGGGAFSGCSSLLAINLPANLATIDGAAFSNCVSLKSVTIPAGVTNIGEGAFSGCSGLTSLKVSEDNAVYDSREKCNAIMESATGKLIAGCENTVIPEGYEGDWHWRVFRLHRTCQREDSGKRAGDRKLCVYGLYRTLQDPSEEKFLCGWMGEGEQLYGNRGL